MQLISKLEAHPTIISAFLNYFDRQPYLMELAKYNDAFIQTLLATRKQGTDSIKISANSLYQKYLHLPYIQQQLQHAEIKGLFGDHAGNADWTKTEAANYLLLSPTKAGRVLIVSEKDLTQMLHPNMETNWHNIALFQHGKRLSPLEYSLSQCYKQEFPLFSHLFTHNGSDALLKKKTN